MLDEITREWFRKYRAMGVGGIGGEEARTCLDYARAQAWLEKHGEYLDGLEPDEIQAQGLTGIGWVEECEPYEPGDAEDAELITSKLESGALENLWCGFYVNGQLEASLHQIVVSGVRDDYCRIVEAELIGEWLISGRCLPTPPSRAIVVTFVVAGDDVRDVESIVNNLLDAGTFQDAILDSGASVQILDASCHEA